MKRSSLGIYQFNQAVGAVVLVCVVLFVGALLNAAGRVYSIDQHGTPLLATGIPPR